MPYWESWRIPYAYSPNGIHTVDLAHSSSSIPRVAFTLNAVTPQNEQSASALLVIIRHTKIIVNDNNQSQYVTVL